MGEQVEYSLSGLMSRRLLTRRPPLTEGRRYRVWLRIREISQGKVCVWVGGKRGSFFRSAGEHIEEVAAGEEQEVFLQGLNALAYIDGLAVKEVPGQAD